MSPSDNLVDSSDIFSRQKASRKRFHYFIIAYSKALQVRFHDIIEIFQFSIYYGNHCPSSLTLNTFVINLLHEEQLDEK